MHVKCKAPVSVSSSIADAIPWPLDTAANSSTCSCSPAAADEASEEQPPRGSAGCESADQEFGQGGGCFPTAFCRTSLGQGCTVCVCTAPWGRDYLTLSWGTARGSPRSQVVTGSRGHYFHPGVQSVSQTPVWSQQQVLCGQVQFGNLFFRELRLVVQSSGSPGPRPHCPPRNPGLGGLCSPPSKHSLHLFRDLPDLYPLRCPFPPCSGFIQAFCFITAILCPKGAREIREGVQESQCRGGSAEPREGAAGNAEQVPQARAGSARPGGPAGTPL